jgi:hypothetical protein
MRQSLYGLKTMPLDPTQSDLFSLRSGAMGYALRKEPEEPFALEAEIDGGGPGGGWTDARLIAWL